MKYLKSFNESMSNVDEKINDLLINKTIVANDSELVDTLPFRIKSQTLTFTPKSFKIVGDSLKIYVNMDEVIGKVSNPHPNQFSNEQAMCFVMTAWIYWQITSKNLDSHFDVMVYPN